MKKTVQTKAFFKNVIVISTLIQLRKFDVIMIVKCYFLSKHSCIFLEMSFKNLFCNDSDVHRTELSATVFAIIEVPDHQCSP